MQFARQRVSMVYTIILRHGNVNLTGGLEPYLRSSKR
jgi:hypothetical protein